MAIAGDYTAIVEVAVSDAKLKQQLEKVSKQLERKPIKINVQMSKGLKEFEKHIIRATQAVEKLKTAMAQFDKNAKLTEAAANRVKVSMDKTRTSANNLDDTVKKVAKSMKSMDDASKQMKISVKAMGSAVKTTSGNIKTLSKIQNQAKKSSKELGETFAGTIERIAKFDAGYAVIRAFKQGVSEAIEVVFDFDASLTEFKKVSDLSGDSLDKYTEKLGKMGEEVARTRSEMIQASTEFKKGGYSDEDSAQLARVASLYQNVADSELSAGDASAYVISQMKAFDIEAEDAMSIIDKTNEVSNNFAVSSTDISSALTKTSGAMATYGNSIDETIGLVTAGTEILTGQAGKVSRGMRSVGAEIVKLANSTGVFSYSVQGATKNLSLFNEEGRMLNTFEVLSKIYQDWNKMNEAEQSSLALTLGMKTQIDVLSATLNNFDTALNATKTAEESHGSAMKENARYMESLEAKITALKSQFSELVLGNGGLNTLIKGFIDLGTAILKFANSDVGQLIIKTTLLITITNLLNKGFNKLKQAKDNIKLLDLVNTFSLLSKGGMEAQFVIGATAGKLKNLTKEWIASPFGKATIAVGVIYAIAKAFDYFHESVAEAQEKLREANQEYQTATKNITSLEEKLADVNKKIDEINNKDNITITDQEQLSLLQSETKELEYQLAIEKEKARLAQIEAEKKAEKVFGEVVDTQMNEKTGEYEGLTREDVIEKNIAEMEELSAKKEELQQKIVELTDAQKTETDEYKNTKKEIKSLEKQYNSLSGETSDFISDLDEATKSLDENSFLYKILIGLKEKYTEITEKASGKTAESAEISNSTKDSLDKMNEGFKDAIADISNLGDVYNTLSNAIDEYNSSGTFSLDTLNSLLSLSPDYLSLLQLEDGQLSLNEDALYRLADARINMAEAEAIDSAQKQIAMYANNDLQDSELGVANASLILGGNLTVANEHIVNTGKVALDSTQAMNIFMQALAGGKMTVSEFNDNQKKVAENLSHQINTLETFRSGLKKNISGLGSNSGALRNNTGAHKGNTGARKSNTDATKAQTEALKKQKEALQEEQKALEAQIKDYDIVIGYVKDLLKEEKEAVEEAKDAELGAIDEKIEALEAEQEAFEEDIESQLDLLEKQRDEQEKYWDDQIDAIKNANKELEENIKLQQLQEALARAKTQKVKVLKGGRFVYAQDEESISKAEEELANYEQQRAVQKQIKELEDLKNQALNSLDKQIEELNAHRDQVKLNYEQQLKNLQDHRKQKENEYNAQIKQYESYAKRFENMLNASARKHAEILYNELVGEQGNWDARMVALGKFVNNYEAKKNELDGIKNQIANIDNQVKEIESKTRGAVSTAQANLDSIRAINTTAQKEADKRVLYMGGIKNSKTGKMIWVENSALTAIMAQNAISDYYEKHPKARKDYPETVITSRLAKHAKGSYSLPDDQIALVADPSQPSNRELVVGSKINRGDGVLGNFQKGTGIIPHGHTLTENLVNLARWSQNGGIERITNNNSSNNSRMIHIENINLPQVHNGQQFVEYLENNFLNDSIQFANLRI